MPTARRRFRWTTSPGTDAAEAVGPGRQVTEEAIETAEGCQDGRRPCSDAAGRRPRAIAIRPPRPACPFPLARRHGPGFEPVEGHHIGQHDEAAGPEPPGGRIPQQGNPHDGGEDHPRWT